MASGWTLIWIEIRRKVLRHQRSGDYRSQQEHQRRFENETA